MLRDDIIFKNGYLSHSTFKNIATPGIRLKEFEWTEKFITRSRQLSDYLKAATINFVKMTKKVCQLTVKRDAMTQAAYNKQRMDLLEWINDLDQISNKDWLEAILRGDH